MLKFFSTRDDENESLLGGITEGKRCVDCTGVEMPQSQPCVCSLCVLRNDDDTARLCLSQKTADTAFSCAHSPHHLKRISLCVAHIPV